MKHVSEVLDDLFAEVPVVFCDCGAAAQPRKLKNANGDWLVRRQCPNCGKAIPPFLAVRRFDLSKLALFDEEARMRHEAAEAEEYDRRRDRLAEARQIEYDERREKYAAYLLTDRWRAKREKVLLRDGYRCTACWDAEATEVHHLTYAHIGDEPLFDLTSVCAACHRRITKMDRNGSAPL